MIMLVYKHDDCGGDLRIRNRGLTAKIARLSARCEAADNLRSMANVRLLAFARPPLPDTSMLFSNEQRVARIDERVARGADP